MRIAQVLLDGAPFYERKSQAIDASVLAGGHQIVSLPDGAQLLHVYAPQQFPASRLNDVKIPYVANGRPSYSMLYKMELSRPRVDYGLSTRERFRPSRRVERLVPIYEELIA